jgi:uncharacterized protein (DUF433 family)
MGLFDRIEVDPKYLDGEPYIRGTRLTVRRVVWLVDQSLSREQLLEDYAELDDEAIRQAQEYARLHVSRRRTAA